MMRAEGKTPMAAFTGLEIALSHTVSVVLYDKAAADSDKQRAAAMSSSMASGAAAPCTPTASH